MKTSHKTSMSSFVYSNEDELMKGQEVLIELGLHVLQFAEYADYELREQYYSLICQVLKRGELSLGQLGYHAIDKLSKNQLNTKNQLAAQY
mmetsp:Transcript_3420/g.2403  ORF Transcript_3420/g.2403 Transcript_3420/m.2403 type:complete len:91 (+) Transcript_3420:967-1239(+)